MWIVFVFAGIFSSVVAAFGAILLCHHRHTHFYLLCFSFFTARLAFIYTGYIFRLFLSLSLYFFILFFFLHRCRRIYKYK